MDWAGKEENNNRNEMRKGTEREEHKNMKRREKNRPPK
jgi:hypothetical protein